MNVLLGDDVAGEDAVDAPGAEADFGVGGASQLVVAPGGVAVVDGLAVDELADVAVVDAFTASR